MATSKSSSTAETPEQVTTDVPPDENAPAEPEQVETTPEENVPVLPPTLAEAGLVGVVGVTAGQYSTPSGSFYAVSPGQSYVVSSDDADSLVEQGAAVKIDNASAG
jgi:hypothetical protein